MRKATPGVALGLLLLVSGAALAQNSKPVTSSADVVAGEVAAVVLGPDGKPATGLTKNDFKLFIGGKEQTIDWVSAAPAEGDPVVAAAAAAGAERRAAEGPEVQPRSLVFVIDDQHIASGDRARALGLVLTILRDKKAGEPVAVYRNYRGTRLVLPFTTEGDRVEAALQKLFSNSPEALGIEGMDNEAPPLLGAPPNVLAATEADLANRDFLRSLGFVMLALAGRPEPKTMVLVAAPTPMPKRLTDLTELIAQATLARVSVLALDPSDRVAGEGLATSQRPREMTGGIVGDSEPLTGTPGPAEDMHIVLANDTGGDRFRGRSAEPLLERVDNLRAAYRIGFTPKDASSETRSVRVVVTKPGYSIRTAKGHRTLNDALRADSKFASGLLSSPVPQGDFPIKLLPPRDPKAPSGRNVLSIEIAIPYAALTFLPKGDRRVADVEVMVVAIDDKGATSEVNRETFDVKVPEDKWEQASKTFFWRPLSMKTKGSGRVLVGVRDVLTSRIGQAFIDYGN